MEETAVSEDEQIRFFGEATRPLLDELPIRVSYTRNPNGMSSVRVRRDRDERVYLLRNYPLNSAGSEALLADIRRDFTANQT